MCQLPTHGPQKAPSSGYPKDTRHGLRLQASLLKSPQEWEILVSRPEAWRLVHLDPLETKDDFYPRYCKWDGCGDDSAIFRIHLRSRSLEFLNWNVARVRPLSAFGS